MLEIQELQTLECRSPRVESRVSCPGCCWPREKRERGSCKERRAANGDGGVAMDVAAAAVHVPAMHFSLPASSRLHPLLLLPTGASSSLLTSTCAAISRGLPVHHGLGRTAVLVGRRVFPRFWSVVITNPKDPFLAARNLGSAAAVASASGAASSASGSRNANVVRRWRPSTVVAGGEFLLRCMYVDCVSFVFRSQRTQGSHLQNHRHCGVFLSLQSSHRYVLGLSAATTTTNCPSS